MAVHENCNNVSVWWFPLDFCQSRYGEYREYGTNSCTLISLIVADKVAKENVRNGTSHILPKELIDIFGSAMNEGNMVYAHLFHKTEEKSLKSAPNLNIPEAITALESERNLRFDLREWFYTHLTSNPQKETYTQTVPNRITQTLKLGIQLFRTQASSSTPKNLFAALIGDSRTTIFVFDFLHNNATFFDSHQHGQRGGAVAAQVSINNLLDLIQWFVGMTENVYNSRPSIYEISFLTTSDSAPNMAVPQIE